MYSKPSRASKKELLEINSFMPFTIFAKISNLDVQHVSEYSSDTNKK